MSEVYFQQLTAHHNLVDLKHLLNRLCVVACFVVAQKGFSNQSEHFPLLSSEYFVELISIPAIHVVFYVRTEKVPSFTLHCRSMETSVAQEDASLMGYDTAQIVI